MESSDDESTSTIGYFDFDDYFDDTYCYDNVITDNPTENNDIPIAPMPSNSNNEPVIFNNEIDEILRTSHTNIAKCKKRKLLEEAPVFMRIRRMAALRARIAMIKSNPKRKTKKDLKEEDLKIRIIEFTYMLHQKKPEEISSIMPWIADLVNQTM